MTSGPMLLQHPGSCPTAVLLSDSTIGADSLSKHVQVASSAVAPAQAADVAHDDTAGESAPLVDKAVKPDAAASKAKAASTQQSRPQPAAPTSSSGHTQEAAQAVYGERCAKSALCMTHCLAAALDSLQCLFDLSSHPI